MLHVHVRKSRLFVYAHVATGDDVDYKPHYMQVAAVK